jgi:hypothetical protein
MEPGTLSPDFRNWETTNPMRVKSEPLAAPQVLADNFSVLSHNDSQ